MNVKEGRIYSFTPTPPLKKVVDIHNNGMTEITGEEGKRS